jgi:CDGSH-type Zn-finger protein
MTSDATPPPGSDGPETTSLWAMPGCVTIRCRLDGPLVVELPDEQAPGVRVIDHEGGEFRPPGGKRAIALCRCGASAAKPFCDGSHRGAGFRAGDLAEK